VDHLFLDQDAIPTLVEVKRSSDTRIRREVVGQMLDYAANGVVYWPVEVIRARFEKTCQERQCDPATELARFLGEGVEPEQFWLQVKTNLQAGRIRMVFVADEIPDELRRIVEFLNSQMDPAEVLAVEIRQFVGEKLKTLVPRVIGQTGRKPPGGGETPAERTARMREEALAKLDGKLLELPQAAKAGDKYHDVVQLLLKNNGSPMQMAEIVRQTGLGHTCYDYLVSLIRRGYALEKREDGYAALPLREEAIEKLGGKPLPLAQAAKSGDKYHDVVQLLLKNNGSPMQMAEIVRQTGLGHTCYDCLTSLIRRGYALEKKEDGYAALRDATGGR
jgi:hypothetical protein